MLVPSKTTETTAAMLRAIARLVHNCKVHQVAQQLLHDQGHIRHCPNHVYHPAVVTVDVVDLNTQNSKTNNLMNRWCLSFEAMIWRNTAKFITLNLKTGTGTIQLSLPDIVILKENL